MSLRGHICCEIENDILLVELESKLRSVIRLHEELDLHVTVEQHGAVVLLDTEITDAFDGVVKFYGLLLAEVGNKAATFWLFLFSFWLFLDYDIVEASCRQWYGRVVGIAVVDSRLDLVPFDEADSDRRQTNLMQKYFEFLPVILGLVVDWERRVDGCAVELDVLWPQLWTTDWTKHSIHLEAEVALLHGWILLK